MDTFAPVALLNGVVADGEPNALLALAWSNYGHFTTVRVRDGAVQGLVSIGDLVNATMAEQEFLISQLGSYISGDLA